MPEPRPTLFFDKSVFQALGTPAHVRLSSAYDVVITPALIKEVAGNLKTGRTFTSGKQPREQVAMLARKFAGRYQLAEPWTAVCREELLGSPIAMNGFVRLRDHVEGYGPDGKLLQIRAVVDGRKISPQEAWIGRVLAGNATEYASGPPRAPFDVTHVLGDLAEFAKPLLLPKTAASELTVLVAVDRVLQNRDICRDLLRWLVDDMGLPKDRGIELRMEVQHKWRSKGRPPFRDHAPYAYHCARVLFLYFIGFHVWPKSREPNDEQDLDYLRYLPFCNVFATDDKLSRAIANHMLNPGYQRIASKADLQRDLAGQDLPE